MHIMFYSVDLAIWNGLPDIRHIKVNNCLKLAIELNFFRAYPYLKPHILFYSKSQAIWHGLSDIRHIIVNYGRESAILNLIRFTFSKHSPTYLLNFPDITHIKVNNGLKLSILNLIELNFFRAYPYLKPHMLFYSKGL